MNVRSGLRSPTVTLSSARMNFGSTRPSDTLINSGGIDKTIADDPRSARQCRLYGVAHMIVASGGEQQSLGLGPEWPCRA